MNWKEFIEEAKLKVPVVSSLERIRSVRTPISPRQRDALADLIDTEAEIVAFDVKGQYQRQLEEGTRSCSFVEDCRAETNRKKQEALANLAIAEAAPRSLVKAVLNWAGAIAAGGCEFLVSLATLPPAFDIPRDSAMGITISLAPVVTFLALKDPADHFLRSAPPRAVHAFHAALAGGLIWVAYTMALARNEVTRVLAAILRGDLNVEFREGLLNNFILAISIVLLFVGATLLSYAFRYGGGWLAAFQGRRTVKRLDRAAQKLAEREGKLRGHEVELREAVDGKPPLVAEAWRRQALLELAGVEVAYPTADQAVDIRFGLDPQAGKGTLFA